ncbi:precorrin-3B synthase [Streptomyces kronopolitis]|uniref:Precorrin-3B synthase n=2 Tax=Streptomyces kronopolitis TaxID=1612435 RepID=A0ABQ2J619_9ACTN|nr:precorrin-3B synthase [Streptomyces kronopolitis]GGN38059.1 precorrin-3B synthase [Streptomyces kronopolitis]
MLAAMPPSPSIRPPGAKPPLRDRGDACPGALRLHSAADGHLARVRLPAGDLTVRQATVLADAADRLGDGHLSLTSRGNAELRGLPEGCGAELADLLRDAGLLPSARHERVRNILASPLAGLTANAPAQVRRWARELDGLLCASEPAAGLSGRFLFVLDDGLGELAGLGGDVSLVAEAARTGEPAGAAGTALLRVGDDPAALRIAGPDAPRAALAAAEAFLSAAAASGSGAWRVRELPDGQRLTARDVAARLHETGLTATYLAQPPTPAAPSSPRSATPGIVDGPDGTAALCVLAPLGRLTSAQWRLLTAVAADDGCGALRLTPWRGLVLPGLPAGAAAARLSALAAAGLITDPDSPWHRLGACTGRPGCAKSLTDVRADAAAAVTAGARLPAGEAADGLPVHWSGCARRCGHPHGAWVDVLATEEGYRVSVVRPAAAPDDTPAPPPHPAPPAPSRTP